MSSTASSLPPSSNALVRAMLKPGNVLPALVWLFFVVIQASNTPFPPSLSTALLVLINSVAILLFVIRRDATRIGNKVEMVIALSGTLVVAFLEGSKVRDTQWFPSTIQLVALFGWAASVIALGRSFGIVPADRGLIQHGLYRYIRHPIYAFEALFFLGYLIAVPTWRSAIIIAVWAILQVIRIVREERILGGYDEYKEQVRWRILPGVW